MNPSQLAKNLCAIASYIEKDPNPSRTKVASALKSVLAGFKKASSGFVRSEKLGAIVATKDTFEAMDNADSSCNAGSDVDGSSAFDLFENGFDLAIKAAGKPIFMAESGESIIFLIAATEQEACARASEWMDADAGLDD